jgi:hypothetical protein
VIAKPDAAKRSWQHPARMLPCIFAHNLILMEGSEPMYAGILSVRLCSALLFVPDRAPIGEEKTPGVETAWYDQLQREGRLTIETDDGKIVFLSRKIAGRKMMDVTIMMYDAAQKLTATCWSKEAELRHDAGKNRMVMEFREGHIKQADGSVGFTELRVWDRSMPKKK